MSKKPTHASDLKGLSRLAVDAVSGITSVVEAVNLNVLKTTVPLSGAIHQPLSNAIALVYRNIRAIANLVGSGIDSMLSLLAPLLANTSGWPGREPVLAVLNGVLGDHLESTQNPLAISMVFRHSGKTLLLERQVLSEAIPNLNGRILVMAHGLCMNDLEWKRRKHDHGEALSRDRGYTTIYLYYNSGRHISINGKEFSEQLETLVQHWPVPIEELVILGHSMGGMLARSAFHYGSLSAHHWPAYLRKLVFLGTPHHGAPLERGGNWFHVIVDNSTYTAPMSSLGKIRSAGITDLRYGNLLDQDWDKHDRFAHVGDQRTCVPLPGKVQCFAIAATTGKEAGDIRDRFLGDGLVPVKSALGQHENEEMNLLFPTENQRIEYGMNHLDLLNRREVYQQLLTWL
jgi:pimeloyl-ACP methyl ester carboxylesterase